MSERISKIIEAISHVNPNNPSDFLADGVTPQLDVLENLSGLEDITAAERTEALNQVNEPTSSAPSSRDIHFKEENKETVTLIGKTMVRVKEGEEQKAWGSSFTALKVLVEDPETGEDEEKMVLLGQFEKGGYEHKSFLEAKPRRAMLFNGKVLSK